VCGTQGGICTVNTFFLNPVAWLGFKAKDLSVPLAMVTESTVLGNNGRGRGVDHSISYSFKVKNTWRYTSTDPTIFMKSCLIVEYKHEER
jgi:hypothetical protein